MKPDPFILEAMNFANEKATDLTLESWQREIHRADYASLERELKGRGYKRTTKGWIK